MTDHAALFEKLCQYARETALWADASALLEWDERTYLPPEGGAYRAEQITLLSGLIHRRRTDPQYGEWLAALAESPLAADHHSAAAATIRQLKRQYDKAVKLPADLVEELARTAILGQQAWVEARKHDDFPRFLPLLQRQIELKQQEADALGWIACRYDALLDDYEPRETTENVRRVLSGLREALVPLVEAIIGSGVQAPLEVVQRHFPRAAQEAFGTQVAARIGFEFSRGRLDVTHHPFCTGLGPHDTRLTTRYDEAYFSDGFYSILHEAGHGIYDQGLRPEQHGLPPGEAVSLGIHESQSRMWENCVGRSRGFWRCFLEPARAAFPEALAGVDLETLYFAVNDVRPSLIRTESDEVTYNLHIIIRFELEQDLLDGRLPPADLPEAWNAKYREYLGIEPPNNADGVLQDVHWSAGLFGYFPTYSLGNLYAAQFFEQAGRDLGDLETQFARGEFAPLREWLRENIHAQGQCYTAAELAERITGKPLSHAPLMQQLRAKFEPLYRL